MYAPRRTAHGGDQAYNWPTLARYANLLIASGYDEHSASGPPGPITTAAGFGQMLDYAARVSRSRVAPAIGAFGYSWPAGGGPGELLSTIAADRLRQQAGARLQGAEGDNFFTVGGRVVYYQTGAALSLAHAPPATSGCAGWRCSHSAANQTLFGVTSRPPGRQPASPARRRQTGSGPSQAKPRPQRPVRVASDWIGAVPGKRISSARAFT